MLRRIVDFVWPPEDDQGEIALAIGFVCVVAAVALAVQ